MSPPHSRITSSFLSMARLHLWQPRISKHGQGREGPIFGASSLRGLFAQDNFRLTEVDSFLEHRAINKSNQEVLDSLRVLLKKIVKFLGLMHGIRDFFKLTFYAHHEKMPRSFRGIMCPT